MKTFKSVSEWLATNPNEVEMSKVLKVINKSVISQIRSEYYAKDRQLHKLNKAVENLKTLGLAVPKTYDETIAKTKKEVDELKKQLPPITKRVKKEK